jgi:hypothetical protein
LIFHFQFLNELFLFSEVGHRMLFGISVIGKSKENIDFQAINNLFHPSTIDGSFVHSGNGICGGFKIKSLNGGFTWNTLPHKDRIINFNDETLVILNKVFENLLDYRQLKLINIQSSKIINIFDKLKKIDRYVRDLNYFYTDGFNETNAIEDDTISRVTKFPILENFEVVYSGPNFFVSNPLYKTPRSICSEKNHYDIIDHTLINDDFKSRTNYIVNNQKGLSSFNNACSEIIGSEIKWLDTEKLVFSKMLNTSSERTLQPSLLHSKTSHINSVVSIVLVDDHLLKLGSLCSSIIFDFLIKSTGKSKVLSFRFLILGFSSLFQRILIFILSSAIIYFHFCFIFVKQYRVKEFLDGL